LRLLKVLTPSGKYKYATGDQADNNLTDRFIRMLVDDIEDCHLSNGFHISAAPAFTFCVIGSILSAFRGQGPECAGHPRDAGDRIPRH